MTRASMISQRSQVSKNVASSRYIIRDKYHIVSFPSCEKELNSQIELALEQRYLIELITRTCLFLSILFIISPF